MVKSLLYIILFLAFFANSLVDYNIVPKYFTILTECCIYILFFYSLILSPKNKINYAFHLLLPFLFFIIIAFFSALINGCINYGALLSLRLVVRFYIFYLALINIDFDELQLRNINTIIAFLVILQLPTQLVKFYFYGVSELTIGTYAAHGGGVTTVLPLMALGYLIAFYYLYQKKIIYLILSFGFILYGILGAKLALLFLYPIAFLCLYYLNVIKIKGLQIPKDFYRIFFIIILTIAVGGSIIKYQARANKDRISGGSIDLSYTLKYSKNYTYQKHPKNQELSAGRLSTTKMALKYLFEDGISKLSFGYGPGIINKFRKGNEFNTKIEKIAGSYGHSGAIYIIVEYGGIALMIIFVIYAIFIKNCFIVYKNETEPYWKAFASGALFFSIVNLFIFTTYNTVIVIGDTIPPLFFYCMAVIYKRSKIVKNHLNR